MSSSSSSSSSDVLSGLYTVKEQKILEQKEYSDRMREILSKMNQSSKMKTKNLQAAIAVSKKAGYFEYYVAPDDVKQAEEQKTLNSLAAKVAKTHKELEAINAEIDQAKSKEKKQPIEVQINDLAQWMSTYKEITRYDESEKKASTPLPELLTKFEPSKKIYGGTRHHRSFKTSATTMMKGTLTR